MCQPVNEGKKTQSLKLSTYHTLFSNLKFELPNTVKFPFKYLILKKMYHQEITKFCLVIVLKTNQNIVSNQKANTGPEDSFIKGCIYHLNTKIRLKKFKKISQMSRRKKLNRLKKKILIKLINRKFLKIDFILNPQNEKRTFLLNYF